MPRLTRRGALLAAATLPLASRAQTRHAATLATAGDGSLFLAYGTAMAKHIAAAQPLDLTIKQTGGSNENIALLAEGQVEVALVNMGPAFDAWHGRNAFEGKQTRVLRALAPMYETPFHAIVLKSSGITTLSGLAGKRVGTGPAGGPGEVFFKGLMAELGLAFTAVPGTPAELGRRVGAGEIDGFFYGSGLPSPPFVALANSAEVTVIGFTEAEGTAYRRRFGYFAPYSIAANTYRGQDAALPSFAVWNFWMAHEATPAPVAEALVRGLFADGAATRAAHPSAIATRAANASVNTFLPFHPAVALAYRDAGAVMPEIRGG